MNQEIIPVEGKLSGDRQVRVYFQRKVVHDLMASLHDTLQDAMVEIAIAPRLYDNPGFFRTMSYGRVAGMKAADLNDYQIQVKKNYQDWCNTLMRYNSGMALSIARRISQEEQSVHEIRMAENISPKTVIRLLQYGLNEYSIIAGWGDVIGQRK